MVRGAQWRRGGRNRFFIQSLHHGVTAGVLLLVVEEVEGRKKWIKREMLAEEEEEEEIPVLLAELSLYVYAGRFWRRHFEQPSLHSL